MSPSSEHIWGSSLCPDEVLMPKTSALLYLIYLVATQFGAKEKKHTIVSRQNVVYSFKCDLCEAGYVGYTCRHLYQRIEEHKSSAVGVHFKNCHKSLKHFETNFTVLRQCKTKFECLVYEMLFIKQLKPSLNVQSDSLKAKLF